MKTEYVQEAWKGNLSSAMFTLSSEPQALYQATGEGLHILYTIYAAGPPKSISLSLVSLDRTHPTIFFYCWMIQNDSGYLAEL